MAINVLVTDHAWPTLDIERDILASVGAELVVAPTGSPEEIIDLAESADAILTNWRVVPPAALDRSSRCLIVSRYGIGVDNIPVDHATELGIIVANVPGFCVDETSDHAMALLLACSRRIVDFDRASKHGAWGLNPIAPGMQRLRGQTLGLIGFGQLAHAVATKALAFGLRVCCYTPRLTPGEIEPGIVATNDLGELLAQSDFVSLHIPGSPSTRGLIDEAALRLMKSTAYLINTSRGVVINEGDLYRALTEGWIAGAALDVASTEPPPTDYPFFALDNVILTPHAAFYSEQAIADVERRAAAQIADVLSGRRPPHIVNPQVLALGSYRAKV